MSGWNIAAAQSGSRAGNITWNIEHHLAFIRQAAELNVDLLVFPELSLTGYELPLMAELAMAADDPRLQVFADAAQQYGMSICVGLPLKNQQDVMLSAATFLADGTRFAYSKRNLFGDERQIFSQGSPVPMFGQPQQNVVLAICADISVEQFARDAAQQGADLYATSVLVSEKGYEADCALLARWSETYQMAVLMANHAWPTGAYVSAGKSAFWSPDGQQVVRGGEGEQLIIARRRGSQWHGEVHALHATADR